MAWTVTYTTDNQAEYDEMKTWFEHKEACTDCGFDPRLVDYALDDANKTVTHNFVDGALDFSLDM